MIVTVTWKLGGYSSSSLGAALAQRLYDYERGINVYSGRPTTWSGKVGLMYPSDYGYATSGGTTNDREECLAESLNSWTTYTDCRNNSWLYISGIWQWTLTAVSNSSSYIYRVNNDGILNPFDANRGFDARPTVYLKSNIIISNGTGTASDPYTLLEI